MIDIVVETKLIANYIKNLRKYFHMHAELSMQEYETNKKIKEELNKINVPYLNEVTTEIIASIGNDKGRTVALRCDMDGLKITENTGVPYASIHEGVMHACGHDAHMASLIGAAIILKKYEDILPGKVLLIFQPSEENAKGAKLICEHGYLDNVDEIIIGNAYASEDEFKAIDQVMKQVYVDVPKNEAFGFLADFIPHGMIKRVPFKIQLEEGITELEKEILFNYPTHSDLGDCMNYMLRSRWTRMIYKGKEIPCRPCTKTHYTRGDVVIVNDNLAHYRGEIQIVLKDMKVDGQRNLLGRIDESEIFILEHIKAKDVFTFVE